MEWMILLGALGLFGAGLWIGWRLKRAGQDRQSLSETIQDLEDEKKASERQGWREKRHIQRVEAILRGPSGRDAGRMLSSWPTRPEGVAPRKTDAKDR